MSNKKILIVDDESNILKSLRRLLEEDYIVEIALGGQQAIELLNNAEIKFDVILSDFMMPVMNGEAFYNEIKKNYPGLEDRIIFMTGGTNNLDVKKFFNTHSNLCLLKPFDQGELLRVIKNL
jgi:CheY-like chemotaxis protein